MRDRLRLLVEKLNLGSLCEMLECQEWDVVVNTHFLPAEIIASLRKKRKVRTPQITVTTDFETHRLWVNPPTDHYCTATEEGARYLEHYGVAKGTVSVTGIPIHPLFAREADRAACLKAQGLRGDRPIVLQLAGGFGVGPIEQIYRGVLSLETPLEIVAVAGKNKKVKDNSTRSRCQAGTGRRCWDSRTRWTS